MACPAGEYALELAVIVIYGGAEASSEMTVFEEIRSRIIKNGDAFEGIARNNDVDDRLFEVYNLLYPPVVSASQPGARPPKGGLCVFLMRSFHCQKQCAFFKDRHLFDSALPAVDLALDAFALAEVFTEE